MPSQSILNELSSPKVDAEMRSSRVDVALSAFTMQTLSSKKEGLTRLTFRL